jgi:hypothetical protein
VEPCGAPKGDGLAGGVLEAMVDGGRLTEEKAVGNRACPGVVASASGSRRWHSKRASRRRSWPSWMASGHLDGRG